jgi:ribosome silencing factor RsfS/YbeB/iojap
MTPTKTTTLKRARTATAARPKAPAKRTTKQATKQAAPRKAATKKATRPAIVDLVVAALEDMKAQNVTVLDVRGLTDVTDVVVIASGTSDRHVKSLAGNVYEKAKAGGFRPIGMEGEQEGEWVLVDLQDAIVHVMLPRVREFYGLEKLWDVREGSRATG